MQSFAFDLALVINTRQNCKNMTYGYDFWNKVTNQAALLTSQPPGW